MRKNKYLSVQQAAKILKVAAKTLRRWEARGILVPLRTEGKHRRYTKEQLVQFLKLKSKSKRIRDSITFPNEKFFAKQEVFRPDVSAPIHLGGVRASQAQLATPEMTPHIYSSSEAQAESRSSRQARRIRNEIRLFDALSSIKNTFSTQITPPIFSLFSFIEKRPLPSKRFFYAIRNRKVKQLVSLNPKQYQNTNDINSKLRFWSLRLRPIPRMTSFWLVQNPFRIFNFGHLNLLRYSIFDIRIFKLVGVLNREQKIVYASFISLFLILSLGVVGARILGLSTSEESLSSRPTIRGVTSTSLSTTSEEGLVSGSVLAESTVKPNFFFNVGVPSLFRENGEFLKDLKVGGGTVFGGSITADGQDLNLGTGSITASNVVYSISTGDGLSITGTQTPKLSNTGVLSFQGSTGTVTLTAGTGISISGTKITNSSPNSDQNIFKTIKVSSTTFDAGSTTDTLEFAAGTGISLSSDTTNKKLTITGSATSGWTDGGTNVYVTTTTDKVGIGTTNPSYLLDINGIINATTYYQNGSVLSTSQWTTSGNDIYYTTGNVGIGTTGTDAPLDVLSTGGTQLRLTYTDGSVYTNFNTDSSGNFKLNNTGGTYTLGRTTAGTVSLTAADNDATAALSIDSGGSGALNLNNTATGDVLLAGGSAATGCTITNSTGALTCAGDITGGSTGTAGFWTRSGTSLSPATTGDSITTSGSISTTGTGTLSIAGAATFSSTVNSNTFTSTALTFAGSDPVISGPSTGSNTISLNSATNGSVLLAGGSGSTGCTIADATGNLTCTGTITSGGGGNVGFWSRNSGTSTLSPVTSGDNVSTTGNISTTGTGTITSAGLLTGQTGLTVTGGTISLNASSNNNININTGTSTGTISIGNSAAGAITLQSSAASVFHAPANTATAFKFTDATNAYLTLDTRTTLSGVSALTFAAGTAPTVASAATAEYTTSTFTPPTITLTGTTQVTSQMDSLLFSAPTITDASALTVDDAATLTIAGAPITRSTGLVTIDQSYALKINAASVDGGTGTVNSAYGLFVDAPTGATANYAAVFNTGNVGVGTTAPAGALHVVGQCVVGNTKLKRRKRRKDKNGEWIDEWEDVEIKDIKEGDEVLSLNTKTGEFEPHIVRGLMNMGIQEVFELVAESGKSIQTTANHPYFVIDREALPFAFVDETGIFEAGGGSMMGVGALVFHGDLSQINRELREIFLSAINSFSEEEKTFEFKFNYIKSTNLDFYKKLLAVLKKHRERWEFFYSFQPRSFGSFWKQYLYLLRRTLEGAHDRYTVLADYLNQPGKTSKTIESVCNIKQVANILQVESQGSVFLQLVDILVGAVGFNLVKGRNPDRKKIAGEVKRLLKQKNWAGVSHGLCRPGSRYGGIPRSTSKEIVPLNLDDVKSGKWIKVKNLKAGQRIATADSSDGGQKGLLRGGRVKWEKIISIKSVGRKQTFDIQVEDTHNFVGNDIVAHNTYINSSSANALLVENNGTYNNIFSVNGATGNVGIGTTVPLTALDVVGSASLSANMSLRGATTAHTFNILDGGTLAFGASVGGDGGITAASPILYLSKAGNIGVGTTSPTQKLHVAGQCVTGDTLLKRRRKRRRKVFTNSDGNGDPDINDLHGLITDSHGKDRRKSVIDQWESYTEWEDVRIDQIRPGDEILTLDENTGEFVVSKVNALMDMGTKDIVKITTASGKTIRTTSNHPYLVAPEQKEDKTFKNRPLYLFIDETGMGNDPNQPYFGVGVLAIKNTIDLNVKLHNIFEKLLSAYGDKRDSMEFKFSNITRDNKDFYNRVLDVLFASIDWEFAALTVKKGGKGWTPYSYWKRYLGNVIELTNLFPEEKLNLVADYLSKPNVSPKDLKSILYKKNIENILQLESQGSLLLQVADILLGAIAFKLREEKIKNLKVKEVKQEIADRVFEKMTANKKDGYKVTLYRLSAVMALSPCCKSSVTKELPLVKGQRWIKVQDLTVGQKIATADGWEGITKIEHLPAEQVYDIEVEDTHNFVGGHYVNKKTGKALTQEQEKAYYEYLQQKTRLSASYLTDQHSEEVAPSFSMITLTQKNNFVKSKSEKGVEVEGVEPSPPGLRNSAPHRSTPTPTSLSQILGMDVNEDDIEYGGIVAHNTYINSSSANALLVENSGTYNNIFSVNGATGNVGIGTTNPTANLQIGATQGTSVGATPSNALMIWAPDQSSISGSAANIAIFTTDSQAINKGGSLEFGGQNTAQTNSRTFAYIAGKKENGTSGNTAGYLQFATNPNAGSLTEAMRIDSNGNVGIGTTGPLAKLDVNGTASMAGNLTFTGSRTITGDSMNPLTIGNTSTSHLILNPAGNIGVGTTSPVGKLDVTDTSNTAASLSLTNNTATTIGNGANTLGVLDLQSTTLTTGNFMNIELNALSSGKGINLTSTSTALSSGSLATINWSPSGSTNIYATGDILSVGTGNAYAFVGNLLNVKSQGSSVFSVSDTAITNALPTSFTAAGDVAVAYDLNFTNPTASYIKSAAPLYLQAGEVFNASDLNLSTYHEGSIILTQDNQPTAAATSYAVQILPLLTSSTNSMTYTALYGLYNLADVNLSGNAATDLTTLYSNYTGLTATAGTIATWYGNYIAAPTGSGTVTTAYGNAVAALSNATSYGLDIGALSGATANYAINIGNITSAATANNFGIKLGAITSQASATSYGISTGAISGAGTATYGINLGANSSTATTNYGINVGAISGAGTTNYGLYVGAVSGASSNYAAIFAGGNVGVGTTVPLTALDVTGSASLSANMSLRGAGTAHTFNILDGGALAFGTSAGGDTGITAASPALYIQKNGNVGIGTTNPGAKFVVSGGTAIGSSYVSAPATDGQLLVSSKVGIGVTNPQYELSIVNGGRIQWQTAGGTAAGYIVGSSVATGDLTIASSGNQNIVINPGTGNVGIGTTSPSVPFEVKGAGTGANIAKFTDVNTTGCTLATGGTISCSSDISLKKNINDLNYGLDSVMSLNPVAFNWRSESDDKTKSLGFIAQEVEGIIPKLVTVDNITGLKELNTIGMVPVLVKAIQEQQLEIASFSAAFAQGYGAQSTKKSAFADLVNLTNSTNGWIDTLESTLSQNPEFVKSFLNMNVELPGVEPGRFGVSIQPSEPASPTSYTLSQVLTDLVNNQATSTSNVAAANVAIASLSAQVASLSARLSTSGESWFPLALQPATPEVSSGSALFIQDVLGVATDSASFNPINLDAEMATISADITVLGRTVVNDLGVTGNINAGLLSINGIDGEINTIGGPLKLQSLRADGIDILNGLVTIDTKGNISTKAYMTAKKYVVDTTDPTAPSLGSETLPVGFSSITINTIAVNDKSKIFITPTTTTGGQALIVSKKLPGVGFVVNVEKAYIKDIKFDWFIVDEKN